MFRYIFVSIMVFFCACKTTSQVKKTKTVGFSVPTTALKKATQFADSKYRRDLSILDFPANQAPHTRKDALVVTPNLPYKGWGQCIRKNPSVRYFLITPGDYRKWGDLKPSVSGTAKQPYVFRYYDPRAAQPYKAPHPVKRKSTGREALLERFHFHEVSHWVLHGLTFRGQSMEKGGKRGGWYNAFFHESNNNTLDFCLIEQVIKANGVRIFNSSNNTIQRCVIRDKIEGFKGDNIGVTVYASKDRNARNNRIVDNEIYDVTDGVHLVYQVKSAPKTGEVPGTIIDNNDLYITRKLYRQKNGEELSCAEDGIDIKVGTNSTRPEDKVLVSNNRIWGFRTTDKACGGGGHGAGIAIHRNAKNILIENNVIFDVSRGISIARGHHTYKNERVENIEIRNNILYDIQETASGAGFALVVGADIIIESNTIKNTRKYLQMPSKKFAKFRKNLILESQQGLLQTRNLNCVVEDNLWLVKKVIPEASFTVGRANTVSSFARQSNLRDYTFGVKRWTRPVQKTIPKILYQ